MLETLKKAQDRADAYQRLLWLTVRQAGGKVTIHPTTMMLWGPTALLTTLNDMSTGGMTLVATIRGLRKPRPTFENDAAMLGYEARDRGEPCQPPPFLSVLNRSLWTQGWRTCDEQLSGPAKGPASSDIPDQPA